MGNPFNSSAGSLGFALRQPFQISRAVVSGGDCGIAFAVAFRPVLFLDEFLVVASLFHELIVCTRLEEFAVHKNVDDITVPDGTKTMGNDNSGESLFLQDVIERFLYDQFRFSVKSRRGFV